MMRFGQMYRRITMSIIRLVILFNKKPGRGRPFVSELKRRGLSEEGDGESTEAGNGADQRFKENANLNEEKANSDSDNSIQRVTLDIHRRLNSNNDVIIYQKSMRKFHHSSTYLGVEFNIFDGGDGA